MNELTLILRERAPWRAVERLVEWGVLPAIEEGWSLTRGLGASLARIEALQSWASSRA